MAATRQPGFSGLALVLWAVGPVFGLAGVLLVCSSSPDVADRARLGSPGTSIAAGLALALTLFGMVVGWTARSAIGRQIGVLALVVALLPVLALIIGFPVQPEYVVLDVLLAQAAFGIGMMARGIHRSARSRRLTSDSGAQKS